MNLLFCCEFYYPSIGGVQEVMRQIAERMVERGHSVTVATSRIRARTFTELNGVRIVEFDINGNAVRGIQGEIDDYRNFAINSSFDLIFIKAAQQWTLDVLLPVLDRLKMKKVLVPCGFSGLYDPKYTDYYRKMPDVLRHFDHLVFYATDYRDINFARAHGLVRHSIVPNGASEREFNMPRDPSFRQRLGISEDAFVVLTVGNLNGFKGHQEVADAFSRAQFGEKKAFLLLNGNKPPTRQPIRHAISVLNRIRRDCRENGLVATSNSVIKKLGRRFSRYGPKMEEHNAIPTLKPLNTSLSEINRTGTKKQARLVDFPRNDLVQAYLNSDLFAFASNIEYSPLVLYEACAAGLPFISAPVGNAEEIARWTGGGEICTASRDDMGYTRVDPARLAKHIDRLVAAPNILRAYGASGRKNWAEFYTWKRIARHYEDIFLRLVQGMQENVEENT